MKNKQELVHPNYRADIDGLRAIAVLAVVGFHAFPNWIQGGFIGVDIFFVISGFLISTIIFSSLERNSFSFIEFYSRRINRIYPALLLVLISCYVFGWFSLLADEYKQLGKHIAGGAGFVANFVLWNESGYFDNVAETKPLLHLWSLGIEEQFYIVWPFILWLTWVKKFNRMTIVLAIGLGSFLLNVNSKNAEAVSMFYSPQTRFWELLIGSALSYLTLQKQDYLDKAKYKIDALLGRIIYENPPESKGKTLENFQSFLGVFLLSIGFFLITKERIFPGWWALIPTLGAALIIAAGSQAWINQNILSNRILVLIGLISFPLYLWHWPLLSFAHIIEAETPSREIRIVAVLASVLLAWITYRFVETPLRFGVNGRAKTIVLFSFMVAVGSIGYNSFERGGLDFRPVVKNLAQKSLDLQGYKVALCTGDRFSHLDMSWCNTTQNNQKIDYIIWGDSHAEHLLPGLKKLGGSTNFALIGRSSCPPIIDSPGKEKLWRGRYFDESCFEDNEASLGYIKEHKSTPVVILSSLGAFYIERQGFSSEHKDINFNDDYKVANRKEIFETGLSNSVNALLAAGKKVVLVKDVPEFPVHPKGCLSRFFKDASQNCAITRKVYEDRTKNYDQIIKAIKAKSKNVYIFDAAAIFCDDKYCRSSDDQHVYFRDGHHLSAAGSDKVAKELMEFIKKIPSSS